MSLLDQLTERTDGRGHRECGVAYALRQLDPHTADKFRTVIAMPNNVVRHVEVMRAFDEEGERVAYDSVRRHRAGECACGSE